MKFRLLSFVRQFFQDKTPKSIAECFIIGALDFAYIVLIAYLAFSFYKFFSGYQGTFPLILMMILFPVAFLKPFFLYWENKKSSRP